MRSVCEPAGGNGKSRFAKWPKAATVGSWLGVNLGQAWLMLVGAIGAIGVVLDTGVFDPNNSDPSSTIAALGLGSVAFLVIFFATVSTNVTVLYGAGMGLIGAARPSSPRKYLLFIAILQLAMCFLPLTFAKFIDYFEFFLGVVGGIFIPLWTLVVTDYFIVRRRQVTDADLFAGENSDGSTKSRLGDWNAAGWWAMSCCRLPLPSARPATSKVWSRRPSHTATSRSRGAAAAIT